jgi:hypothetical protein
MRGSVADKLTPEELELIEEHPSLFDADVLQALVRALPEIGVTSAAAEPAIDVAAFGASRHLALVGRS